MEAIVLAGGFGTRLQSVVRDVPKPMAEVKNRPFLEYILDYLDKNGIKRVILSVGYKWEIIKNHFGNRYKNLELVYSIENEPLLTGGAIKKALNFAKNSKVFVINGDTYFNIPLLKLKEKDADIVIALKRMYNFDRYGTIDLKENKIIRFNEKFPMKEGLINGGIYLIKKNIFDNINENKFSFEEFLEQNVSNLDIRGEVFEGYFIDIGIPEDYERANKEL